MIIIETIKKALKLDSDLYLKVERDISYHNIAITILVMVCLMSAIGFKGTDILGLILTIFYVAIAIIAWMAIIIVISSKLINIRIEPKDLARCLGIAFSPMIFNILNLIPIAGLYFSIIVYIWTIVSVTFTIKNVLDQDISSAFILSALASIPYFIIRVGFIGI